MRYKKYIEGFKETYFLKFNKGITVCETKVPNYYGVQSLNDNGEFEEDKEVEVFLLKLPLKYNCLEDIYITATDRLSTGFKIDKFDTHYEFKFYNHTYAIHKIFFELEKCKILKIKKIIYKPKWENTTEFFEDMELFPAYINPRGLWQCTYDVVVALIELGLKFLYKSIKSIKNKNNQKGEMKNV